MAALPKQQPSLPQSKWKTQTLLTDDYKKDAAAEQAALAKKQAEPKRYRLQRPVNRNMNNLPGSITIGQVTWTRTKEKSAKGTYSYGSGNADSNDIANNPHYTVAPVKATPATIYNVHYTVPNVADPTQTTRTKYYIATETWDPERPTNELFQTVKNMVDKLFFEWVWFTEQPKSAANS
jgi:hypothetical protein